VEVFSKELEGVQDLAPAFDYVKNSGAQGLIFITDNLMFGRRKEVAALALSHHLPSIHSFPPEVEDGGLMSYGPDQRENYRRAAALADNVLKGERPADLPAERTLAFKGNETPLCCTFDEKLSPTEDAGVHRSSRFIPSAINPSKSRFRNCRSHSSVMRLGLSSGFAERSL